MQVRVVKNKNRLFYYAVAWTAVTGVSIFYALRRYGFVADYARVKCVCAYNDNRTMLEPGAIPQNPFLPPHLRCDHISYLDDPDCRIPLPPNFLVWAEDGDLIQKVRGPPKQKRELVKDYGGVKMLTVISSRAVYSRSKRQHSAENVDEFLETDKNPLQRPNLGQQQQT